MSTWQKPPLGSQPIIKVPGLVGDWVMNESGGSRIYDFSGNGRTGTLQGGSTWVPGRIGPALSFGGSMGYIDLGLNKFVTGSQNRTLIAWIRPDTVSNERIFSLGKSATGEAWRFFIEVSGNLRIEIQGSGFTSSLQPPAGNWSFVACVLDGTTIGDHTIYLNRESEATSGADTVNTASDVAVIGISTDKSSNPFDGQIDLVKIYNQALTPGEIQQLYIDSFWYFRHDPIELWAAATSGAAPAGIVPPSSGILRGVQRGILKGVA